MGKRNELRNRVSIPIIVHDMTSFVNKVLTVTLTKSIVILISERANVNDNPSNLYPKQLPSKSMVV